MREFLGFKSPKDVMSKFKRITYSIFRVFNIPKIPFFFLSRSQTIQECSAMRNVQDCTRLTHPPPSKKVLGVSKRCLAGVKRVGER